MDFKLTAEQEMIRKQAKDFAEKKIEPLTPEIERTGGLPYRTMGRDG